MAAGFSVLFGAPLGAAIFALEIPHRRGLEYYEALVPAAIGALCGYAVSTAFGGLGLEPIWTSRWSTGSPASTWRGRCWLERSVRRSVWCSRSSSGCSTGSPTWCRRRRRPMLGGIALGLLALVSPYALTNGEFQIETLLDSRQSVRVLVVAGLVQVGGSGDRARHGLAGRVHHPVVLRRVRARLGGHRMAADRQSVGVHRRHDGRRQRRA